MPRLARAPLALLMLLAGCAGNSPSSPGTDPGLATTADPLPGRAIVNEQGLTEVAFGGYSLAIDAAGQWAEVLPWRNGMATDDLYFLGIDQFLNPSTFGVTGITLTGSEVQLHWRFTHPFPAPDLFSGPSAKNRADLGVAARILLLADIDAAQVPDRTFFGDVVANNDLLLNPDGYWQPGGLLDAGTANTNAFPYQLVVDEAANAGLGNREGRPGSNGGRGNFTPGEGGWQRSNIGDGANWTGYGIIHQGQSTTGTMRLDRSEFPPPPARLSINLGVVAKYNDPRGVPDPRSNRLPPADPDVMRFTYRMPHGALDVERVTVETPATIPGGDPAATTIVRTLVRDWDARAATTLEPDLGVDFQVDTVASGEAGAPTVEVSVPAVTGIEPAGTELDPGTKSGLPGEEIVYEATVTATNAPADGIYPALVRVTDPEFASPSRRSYTLDLDQNLLPITDPLLQVDPITYQFTNVIVSSGPNAPPTCDGITPSSGFIEPGGTFTVNLSGIIDDSANLQVSFDYTGPSSSSTGTVTIPVSGLAGENAFDPFADTRINPKFTAPTELGAYLLEVHLSDGVNMVECGPYPFTVGIPGQCPAVTSNANSLGELPADPDWHTLGFLLIDENDNDDIDGESGIGTTDLAGFRNDTGSFLIQGNVAQNFWQVEFDAEFEGFGDVTQLTSGYPGPGFASRAHTYEVDGNGRVLWVASNVTQSTSNTGLEASEVYASAGTVIHFFDTNGTLPVTADRGTFDVGAKVVAMAIAQDNAVWALDSTNTMHRYTGAPGGTVYSEDTTVTFSLTTASAGALTGAIVEDFDINYYNQAFFVAVCKSDGQVDVWRFECNGTYSSSIQGNANPVLDVFGADTADRADIVIDNYGVNGAVLAGPQDAQIIVTGDNGPGEGGVHDAGLSVTLTARMQKSPVTIGGDGAGRTTFLYSIDRMFTTESLSNDEWCEEWTEIYLVPAGWQ